MFSLRRSRKTAAKRTGECVRFTDLPDDILVLIYSECTIDELYALRLTDRRSASLIFEYINTIAPAAARTTFTQSHNLLLHRPLRYTIQWLSDLVPQQLAAILVDRHRMAHDSMQQRYGIPAEDVEGDVLRARIANGWRVLNQLHKISEEVQDSNASDTSKFRICSSRKGETSRQMEDLVLERRLAFIDSMPIQDAQDYKLMFMLLSSAFRTSMTNSGEDHKPWMFDWGSGIDGQRLFRKGSSWLAWFVLAKGPTLFWKQWWTLPHASPSTRHYIRDCAIEAWTATPQKLVDHQRDHARKIQEAVNSKANVAADFQSVNPIPYFTQYAECRLSRWNSGILPVKETMSHVPFHIEFRCPKEMVQQYQLLLGKGAAQTNKTWARA
ncbi:hypothetical protein SVAN01_03350 [Stagonosporopsis vannaccii]|nr:hypothetical protein SVAN01_03350 [Stagonosporopsis vannaccii]